MKKFTHSISNGELQIQREEKETSEIDDLRSLWKDTQLADLPKEERNKLHLSFSFCKIRDFQLLARSGISTHGLFAQSFKV